jgi:hypothetical protein
MLKRGFASGVTLLSSALIIAGLVLALWWMHSAEEQVIISHVIRSADSSRRIPPVSRGVPATKQLAPIVNDVIKPKVKELQQILDSKNDNDPRLDTDFKVLNDIEKKTFEKRYLAYAPERLNERGTLAFLIGRNLTSKDDISFMNHILEEPPCQSLESCSIPSQKSTGDTAHHDSLNSITLAYPQIVAIKALETVIFRTQDGASELRTLAVNSLTQAEASRNTTVANYARQTLRKLAP